MGAKMAIQTVKKNEDKSLFLEERNQKELLKALTAMQNYIENELSEKQKALLQDLINNIKENVPNKNKVIQFFNNTNASEFLRIFSLYFAKHSKDAYSDLIKGIIILSVYSAIMIGLALMVAPTPLNICCLFVPTILITLTIVANIGKKMPSEEQKNRLNLFSMNIQNKPENNEVISSLPHGL